jgi:amino acid adenylation domain-containing protein
MKKDSTMTTSSLSQIPMKEDVYVFPTSFTQQSLWFLNQLEPQSAVYNMPTSIRLNFRVNAEAMAQSLNAMVERHEALRTTFRLLDGQPVQVIKPTLTITVPVIDLRTHPETERESEAYRLANEAAREPFDLVEGPLIRATLLQLDAGEFVLLVNMHHIISDGWSIGVFLRELSLFYDAFSNRHPAPLTDLPIQYADYAAWQREWLQGEQQEEQMAYWRRQLKDAPAILELPTDHPRPGVPTFSGSMQTFTLSRDLTEALKTMSRQEGVTLYMTLVAAFQSLLYRYSGQEDIVIGSPTAGRTRPETEGLIGAFINTLVLRTDLSGNPTFRQLLGHVRKMTLEAQVHADIPFEYIVKELHPERDLNQHPFFQVLLSLETSTSTLPEGWTVTFTDIDTGTSKFDLSIIIEDRPDGLAGRFEYRSALFDAGTIQRMIGHWQMLLEGVTAKPEQQISQLPLLTQAERQLMLVEWHTTNTPYHGDSCVHSLFEEQVKRNPDAVALIYNDKRLTYKELNTRANQLAHYLQKLGVGPEVLVGICMDRSVELIVGLLGILKAGGAYLPLDTAYPQERLSFMLEYAQSRILLTQQVLADALSAHNINVICLDTEWEKIAQERVENPVSKATSDNLAYVMYTSGSTGKPKGVEILHRNINRLVFGANYATLDEAQTILHMAPISFDASTFEVWGALLHGARCVLVPERIPTPKSIGAIVRKHKVTTAWITASLFNAIIDEAPEALSGIQQLLTGGEALSVAHVRRALSLLPSTQLINGYGPHETTTFACCYTIPRQIPEDAGSIPIGRPIGNTQLYILDRYNNPVPSGVPGELHIGGAGVARGYLHRPELTNEKFVADPFSDEQGARLYKTGDLVRYRQDGVIEFLGRLDQQVKIRGFRIELGEIEAILGQHPGVRDAAVIAHQNERAEKRLVAYIVSQRKQKLTISELRRYLDEQLPEYMIPSDFLFLDAIPLTPNGKLDTRSLPAPEPARRTGEETYVAPTEMAHYQLIEIWEELLDARPIGIRDNFFYLGGHSLLAARLIDKIEQVFKKQVPLSTLFTGPTIEQLADALKRPEDTDSRSPVINVQGGGDKVPFFYLPGDWNSGAFYCYKLAHDLGSDQPFYVLERYRFDGLKIPPTFEEIAAEHIKTIRAIQPEGPYLLGGFCNGGLEAYEIARQLVAAGQIVDLLIMFDPATPYPHTLVRKVISRFSSLLRLGEDKQLNIFLLLRHMRKYLRHKYRYMRDTHYRRMLQGAEQFGTVEKFELGRDMYAMGFELPRAKAFIPSAEALRDDWPSVYLWVASGYKPGNYPGKITFFWSGEEFASREEWYKQGEAKDEIHIIPGTHMTCRTDNVHILAEHLSECISRLQTKEFIEEV